MTKPGDVVATLREWVERVTGTVLRRRSDSDLERELAFHLEQAEAELVRQGYGAEDARRLARVRAGNADRAMEELRVQGGIPWFGTFTLDVLLGWRMLRKFWGMSLIGGLALAVAITICACVFLYFDVIWSTELPLDDADEVVAIQIWDPLTARRRETTLADFQRWRDNLTTLRDVGAFRTVQLELVGDNGESTRIQVAEMSAAGFRVARTAPLLGRTFVDDDELPSAPPVTVIGYREWQRRFGGEPDALGRTIRLGDSFHTIVGIMPDTFGFPVNHRLWIPLRHSAEGVLFAPPGGGVFARLAPGRTLADAGAELDTIGLLPNDAPRAGVEPVRLAVLPYVQNFIDDIDPDEYDRRSSTARIVILLMSLLLVPPGINIAILVYARTITRQQEVAVRAALGASRSRVVVQMFVEMLVLSAAAAAIALVGVALIGHYVEDVVLRRLGALPFWIDLRLSASTVAFAAVLAGAAALLTGVPPALRATRQFGQPGLSALESRNRARLGAFWTALIIAQVAISFALLPVATELAWGVLRADVLGPGFPAEQYLSGQLSLETDSAPTGAANAARQAARFNAAQAELARKLRLDPSVLAGPTLASAVAGRGQLERVEIDAPAVAATLPAEAVAEPRNPVAHSVRVDDAYFETFEARPLAGRTFTRDEFVTPSRSVVVTERFVERTLGGVSPLGLKIHYAAHGDEAADDALDESWYEIVGVVADVPAHAYRGTVYHPLTDASTRSAIVAVRVSPGTTDARSRLLAAAAATSPPLRVSELSSLDEIYDGAALGSYLGGFALISATLSVLLLAAAGTYALMSFTVNDRRREIGIRVALGAPTALLLRGVLRRALRQVLAGAVVGVLLAVLIEQKIPVDSFGGIDIPGVLPTGALLVILVGLAAAFGPARRVLRTDPNVALRDG